MKQTKARNIIMRYSKEELERFHSMMAQVGSQDIRNPAMYMEVLDSRLGIGEEALEDAGYGDGPGNRARNMQDIVNCMVYSRFGIKPEQLETMDQNFVMGLAAGAAIREDMKEAFGFQDKKNPPRFVQGLKDFCAKTRDVLTREREAAEADVEPVAEVETESGTEKIRTEPFFKRWFSDTASHVAAGFNKARDKVVQAGHDAVDMGKAAAGRVKGKVLAGRDAIVEKAGEIKDRVAGMRMDAEMAVANAADNVKVGAKKLAGHVADGATMAAGAGIAAAGAVKQGAINAKDAAVGKVLTAKDAVVDKAVEVKDKTVEAGRRGIALGKSLGDLLPKVTFSKPNKSLAQWKDSAMAIISGEAPEVEAVNVFDAEEVVSVSETYMERVRSNERENTNTEYRSAARERSSRELDTKMADIMAGAEPNERGYDFT